jgi:hypothetical protein
MSEYQQQNYQTSDDPAASTQMFRAFVDEGRQEPGARREQVVSSGGGRSTGLVIGVIVAIVVVAAVAYLALK